MNFQYKIIPHNSSNILSFEKFVSIDDEFQLGTLYDTTVNYLYS